jgi:hypothetical protein
MMNSKSFRIIHSAIAWLMISSPVFVGIWVSSLDCQRTFLGCIEYTPYILVSLLIAVIGLILLLSNRKVPVARNSRTRLAVIDVIVLPLLYVAVLALCGMTLVLVWPTR